jgi:hypothetical protein
MKINKKYCVPTLQAKVCDEDTIIVPETDYKSWFKIWECDKHGSECKSYRCIPNNHLQLEFPAYLLPDECSRSRFVFDLKENEQDLPVTYGLFEDVKVSEDGEWLYSGSRTYVEEGRAWEEVVNNEEIEWVEF